MTASVLALTDLDATMLELVGGKGANLGELARIDGIHVPDGFCITTDGYARTVGGSAEINALLGQLTTEQGEDSPPDPGATARLRNAIQTVPLPADLTDAITAELLRLGPDHSYAVRSSATAEDAPTASFAGQLDSHLNVIGVEAVLRQVRACWASAFTDRAVTYRRRNGLDQRAVRVGVVVQRMVRPAVAGVMFTADPVTGDRTLVSIDAALGLGEALVSGSVTPDTYTVRDGVIQRRRIARQTMRVEPDPAGGTRQRSSGDAEPKLGDPHIRELERLGRLIEAHFGRPQDIEWCLEDGDGERFWIVQSRPITTLFPIPGPLDGRKHVYMSLSHQQMMTDAMTPLGMSFFETAVGGTSPVSFAGGRIYADLAADLANPIARAVLPGVLSRLDPLMGSAVRALMRRKEFVAGLSRGGAKLFGMGTGYFTWALPVETLKAYRRNDPHAVDRLMATGTRYLADLEQRLARLRGEALFAALPDEFARLREALYDERSMGAVYTGTWAVSWTNRRMKAWLGVNGASDVLSRAVTNNVTSLMGLELLDVADAVRAHPQVARALPTLRDDDFFESLAGVDGGAQAARAIAAFLERYGIRCPGEIDITRPRWRERPTELVPLILTDVARFEPGERARLEQRHRREAEDLERDLLTRLGTTARGRRRARRARVMMSRLRHFTGYREYPKYWMVGAMWLFKRALLGEAAGLVADGAIDQPEDVYFLSLPEFAEAVRTRRVDRRLVAARRAEHEVFERLSPPRVITSDGEIVTGSYDSGSLPAGALAGLAASAGVVEGRARVVRSLAEAHVEPGDILVTTFTDPSWTPVFLTVSGLITEVGGPMTHGAVVAREYGLPAVVGVEDATTRIRDGQRVRLDGSAGYVELL